MPFLGWIGWVRELLLSRRVFSKEFSLPLVKRSQLVVLMRETSPGMDGAGREQAKISLWAQWK